VQGSVRRVVHLAYKNRRWLCLYSPRASVAVSNAEVKLWRRRIIHILYWVKVKVKFTLVQVLRLCTGRMAHRGSRGIALPFLDHGTRRGEGSASRPGRSLPSGKTRYPSYRRLGGPQGRSGQVRKISPPPGFDPRTVQPVASRYTDYGTRPTYVIGRCKKHGRRQCRASTGGNREY